MNPPITVIIPTRLAPERREFLHRAIDSILQQPELDIRILIVVNGGGIKDQDVRDVSRYKPVTVVRVMEASLPLALQIGREHVRTQFFSILDDDDFFLPNGLSHLYRGFRRYPEAHAIIGNAIMRRDGCEDSLNTQDFSLVRTEPLRALVNNNWLVPGSALFRTEAIPETSFANIVKYLEWTYLAAVLCKRHTLAFISEAVVVHHVGRPLSLDQSPEALFGRIRGLQAMLSLPLPNDVKHEFRRRLSAHFHDCSEECLRQEKLFPAVRYHLHSLVRPGGWRYVSYTRHLLHALTTGRIAAV